MSKTMESQGLPKGWTQERVDKLADSYDCQTEAEALAEDETHFGEESKEVTVEEARRHLLNAATLAARSVERLSDEDVLKLYEEWHELESEQEAG